MTHVIPISQDRHYHLIELGIEMLDENGHPFRPSHIRVHEISTGTRVWAIVSGPAVKKNGMVGKVLRSRRFQLKGDPRGVWKSQLEVPEWLTIVLSEAGDPIAAAHAA